MRGSSADSRSAWLVGGVFSFERSTHLISTAIADENEKRSVVALDTVLYETPHSRVQLLHVGHYRCWTLEIKVVVEDLVEMAGCEDAWVVTWLALILIGYFSHFLRPSSLFAIRFSFRGWRI